MPVNGTFKKTFEKQDEKNSKKINEVFQSFREAKRISCTKTTAIILCSVVLLLVLLSSFITYWITKRIYEQPLNSHSPYNDVENVTSIEKFVFH